MRILICIMLFFLKISFAGAANLDCDSEAQNLDMATLKSQGYTINKVFTTYGLTYQYGGTKNFELMPAYELRNKEGDVKFATCKGLYSSPYRYGEYVIVYNETYGSYAKIEPSLTKFYENSYQGIRISYNSGYSYNGELKSEDFKVNNQGDISELVWREKLVASDKPLVKVFGHTRKIINQDCLTGSYLSPLPFTVTNISNTVTVKLKSEDKDYDGEDIAMEGLLEKFKSVKDQCESVLGHINVCNVERYPEVPGSGTRNCYGIDLSESIWYSPIQRYYNRNVPGQITTTLETYEIKCTKYNPWNAAENKCELKDIPKTSSAEQNIRIIEIIDSAGKEDIVVPAEIIVPPGEVSFKLVNHSSFTVTFKGSTNPAEGYLKPYKYGQVPEEAVVLKAMPGNEIKLSPYANKFHFVRFKN